MKITVRVTPNAKETRVERLGEGIFAVWVREPPREGRANRAVRAALAEFLGIVPSRLSIASGRGSRRKIVSINN